MGGARLKEVFNFLSKVSIPKPCVWPMVYKHYTDMTDKADGRGKIEKLEIHGTLVLENVIC